ncbi:MAG: hypothetical protein IJZ15_00985 [Oscillospiraceae bacterium]|nr:hypothetical protein [Oscillospiraceae bacterium]
MSFWYGFSELFGLEPGWREIKVSSGTLNCSEDFALLYNYVDAADVSATVQNKRLTALYTKATEDAYQLFNNEYASDELHNIRYVNEHINQEITVEPALYDALSAIVESGNRSIYLAPAYAQYNQLFVCENDAEAAQYDPQAQPDTKAYIAEIAGFANDPQMIDIQLLGDQRIKLQVAQAYLTFIEENEIAYLLDFSWMTNAFIADYIADILIGEGFTNGYLASYDGFTRNLCDSGQTFELNVFHRVGNDILIPATLSYPGGNSLVAMRDFPINETDRWHYYAFEDGRIASLLLDPADGTEKSAVSSMISYSKSAGCAQILLSVAPLFIADDLDAEQLDALTEEGIYTVYPEGNSVYTNDESLTLKLFENYNKINY